MTFVSITRLRIRAWRFLPAFGLHTMRSIAQVRRTAGFRGGHLLLDRRWTFWTMTAWEGEADMRAYMSDGDHRTAMLHLIHWCDQASVVHWTQAEPALPTWREADRRMREEGRPSKVRFASADHASLGYAPPRARFAGPIEPARVKT